MIPHVKLFSPGPVEVSEKTLAAMARPLIGHRGGEFKKLYGGIQPRLQTLFDTKQPVMLSTSSAWGVMEGMIRNLVPPGGRVLNCMCGAFSDKWFDVSQRAGRQAEALRAEWGQPIRAEALEAALSAGRFDAVTIIHNETSTGVLNWLGDLCPVLRRFPDTLSIVDTVSSFSSIPIAMDELGIDVMLTGSQKALALPPGLALFAASARAYERAKTSPDRGYYFDLNEFQKNQADDMTPSTPSVSHIYALESKLDDIFAEGLENRYARHARTNAMVHDWVRRRGFEFFAPEGYRSVTLTCVANNRGIDVAKLVKDLRERHRFAIDGGYGKLKGKTFRLSNMGDETEETIGELLAALDDCLG